MELNRRIVPGAEEQSEVMETAGDIHNGISKALFPIAQLVFDDAETLNAADGMLHADAKGGMPLIDGFIEIGEGLAFCFFLGLENDNAIRRKALETQILA